MTTDSKSLIARYNSGVKLVETAFATLSESDLDRSLGDEWSPRMVIHHLADSETNSYVRLRRLLAEESGTLIQGYDEERWANAAELGYRNQPVELSFAVFRAVRAASADVLSRLAESDFARRGVHTESGDYTLLDWLRIYADHAEQHAQQILSAQESA
jgi:DinB superfamily